MLLRNLIVILFVFAKFHSFQGCTINKNKVNLPCREYDLNNPFRIKLGDQLSEISGISYYPKDTSVFAISDETGSLYKIYLNRKNLTDGWKFDKTHDFEDVLRHDSSFYILESNGNIETIQFSAKGDTIFRRKSIFPAENNRSNEFESMYYDEGSNQVVIICKDCAGDKEKSVSAWAFNPDSGSYSPSSFSIDVKDIAKKTGQEEIKLKPSAAAVNPVTHDLWILCSTNQLLIVTDTTGITRAIYTLAPAIFKQPEGISFTPSGSMLISNEATDKYETSTLLIFKHQKRG
jgi:uncharacterized protein YjiK